MANTVFDIQGELVDSVLCDRYADHAEKLPTSGPTAKRLQRRTI